MIDDFEYKIVAKDEDERGILEEKIETFKTFANIDGKGQLAVNMIYEGAGLFIVPCKDAKVTNVHINNNYKHEVSIKRTTQHAQMTYLNFLYVLNFTS